MTREKAYEILDKLPRCTECDGTFPYNCDECDEAFLTAFDALKQPEWIPISERNPHTSGTYIVAIRVFEGDDKYILSSACYFDGSDTWYNDNRINHERPYATDKIIAWMPLPEPPKEGEQDETD